MRTDSKSGAREGGRQQDLDEILGRNRDRLRQFEVIANRRPPTPPLEEETRTRLPVAELSHREHQVLALVADGFSNKRIAAELDLTENTIKSHVQSVLAKLDAKNRSHAVALGCGHGLVGARPRSRRDVAGMYGPVTVVLRSGQLHLERLPPNDWIVSFRSTLTGERGIRVYTHDDGVPQGEVDAVLAWARGHILEMSLAPCASWPRL